MRTRTMGILAAGSVAAVGLVTLAALAVRGPAGTVTPAPETVVVLSLPVDDDHVGIRLGKPDEQDDGPAGLAVGPDGTIWIADSLHDRLLGYPGDGSEPERIDLRDVLDYPSDLAVGVDEIAVLDVASWCLARLDRETGAVIEVVELPPDAGMESGLSGVAFGPNGELVLELEGGSRTATRATATGRAWNVATGRLTAHGPFRVRPTSSRCTTATPSR